MNTIRQHAIQGLKAGDRFLVRRVFTEKDMRRFADISRDYNPVHFDERFAAAKGFRGRICHGLLVAGMLTEIGGQLGWLASGMDFKFIRPVYFGDTVSCEVLLLEVKENGRARAEAHFRNQAGETVIKGMLSGIVPGEADRRIMASSFHPDPEPQPP